MESESDRVAEAKRRQKLLSEVEETLLTLMKLSGKVFSGNKALLNVIDSVTWFSYGDAAQQWPLNADSYVKQPQRTNALVHSYLQVVRYERLQIYLNNGKNGGDTD